MFSAFFSLSRSENFFFDFSDFISSLKVVPEKNENHLAQISPLKGVILMKNGWKLMEGEKLELMIKLAKNLRLDPVYENKWQRNMNINVFEKDNFEKLVNNLETILRVAEAKAASKEFGFICLYTDGKGTYWYKVCRGFPTALSNSLNSLEKLIDDAENLSLSSAQKEKINIIYRHLNSLYE